ncbi:hypothetical protein TRVA0_040S00100 [Trichomonascus vanleenenianus]|uniref:uncharacterized protein n=1 Tax=Trichomonascus vanleenenianus TaxID=2268995 RepID=UPI003ECAA90C
MSSSRYNPFAVSNTKKVNRGWAAITAVALSTILVSKLYLNNKKQDAYDMDEEVIQPGAFTGESTVQRKSPYEGAGNSYMGRKGGDRFS